MADALLPGKVSDFRTPEYWRSFFATRSGKTFEWYGAWEHFGSNVVEVVSNNPALSDLISSVSSAETSAKGKTNNTFSKLKVLVLGCGNSEMSAHMYEAGFTDILNVDFDAGVIDEMSKKHKHMTYKVADVRDLSFISTNSFHLVVDKGTLDAMMTDDSVDVKDSVGKMFAEVERILIPGGSYVTITLAQDHLTRFFVSSICSAKRKESAAWQNVTLETFRQLDYASAALQFVFHAQKNCTKALKTTITLRSPTSFQPKELPAKGKGKSAKKPFKGVGVYAPVEFEDAVLAESDETGLDSTIDNRILSYIHENQWGFQTFKSLAQIAPGQYTKVDLWYNPSQPTHMILTPGGHAPPVATSSAASDSDAPVVNQPRFSVTVVDISLAYSAAVLLVPQGREHEWAFGTRKGQEDLARQVARYGRIFFVTLNRGHTFASSKAVQDELSSVVMSMIPPEMQSSASSIPFLAVADDIGHRTLVASGSSALSGDYVVEDVEVKDEEEGLINVRRLLFGSNKNAIQTECKLQSGKTTPPSFDHSDLRFDYQCAMVACLAHSQHLLCKDAGRPRPTTNVLLLGLGGGALPSFLAGAFPHACRVACVDIDPVVVDIATQHFGFNATVIASGKAADGDTSARGVDSCVSELFTGSPCSVVVADAQRIVQAFARQNATLSETQKPDIIIIDVDAKDASSPLSFPPLAFINKDFIASVASVLNSEGLLLVNFSARVKALEAGALATLQKQFGNAVTISLEHAGDANSILCASTRDFRGASKPTVRAAFEGLITSAPFKKTALDAFDEYFR